MLHGRGRNGSSAGQPSRLALDSTPLHAAHPVPCSKCTPTIAVDDPRLMVKMPPALTAATVSARLDGGSADHGQRCVARPASFTVATVTHVWLSGRQP